MRRWARVLAAGAGALLAAAAQAAPPEDGKAAFERREDKMKHMGRPFYLGIGAIDLHDIATPEILDPRQVEGLHCDLYS